MKKRYLLLLLLSVLFCLITGCNKEEQYQKATKNDSKIKLDDFYQFIKQKEFNNAKLNSDSDEFSRLIYYVGDKGLDREVIEASEQVSSQRVAAFTLSDGTTVYLLIGEIMEDVIISEDIVIEFSQSALGSTDPYVTNTVFAFNNIIISSISNNKEKSVNQDASINFNVELSKYIKEYISEISE